MISIFQSRDNHCIVLYYRGYKDTGSVDSRKESSYNARICGFIQIRPEHTNLWHMSSHYCRGKTNGPTNPFSYVQLTISLIIFGLFIRCFPLQKASALVTDTHTSQLSFIVWNANHLLQLCSFTGSLHRFFHVRFVTTNSVNFLSLSGSGQCAWPSKGNVIRDTYII